MANPFPFTAVQGLTAAQMNGIGEALTYTPTFPTNFTLGNGTVAARYVRVQKMVYVQVIINCGSTTAATGLGPTVSLPVTAQAANANMVFGTVWWFDTSAGLQIYGSLRGATTTSVTFNTYNAGTAYLGITYAQAGVPFVITTGDSISMSFAYEAA